MGLGVDSRHSLALGGTLAAAAAAAWAALIAMGEEMPMGAGPWVVAWTLMMAAMMLPSAAPLVLLYGRRSSTARGLLLAAGYLLAWAVVGGAAFELDMRLPNPGDAAITAVLVAAGLYQLTPIKDACLKRCRNPLDYLVTHWRPGTVGALRLGIEHGAYCVGCCWALMVVLVVAGSMGIVWVAAIALAVAVEKLLPAGRLLGRLGGVGLVAAGIAVAF